MLDLLLSSRFLGNSRSNQSSELKRLSWASKVCHFIPLPNILPTSRFAVPCPHKSTSRWLLWYTSTSLRPCDFLTVLPFFLKRSSDVFPALRHALTLRFDENSREHHDDRTPVSHVSSPALDPALPDQNTHERRRFSFRKSQRKSQHANRLEEGKERRLASSILLALYIRRGHGRVA